MNIGDIVLSTEYNIVGVLIAKNYPNEAVIWENEGLGEIYADYRKCRFADNNEISNWSRANNYEYFRLEYKSKSGGFHLDSFRHLANSYGWKTICPVIKDTINESGRHRCASDFIELMSKKYHIWLCDNGSGKYPSYEQVKKEFEEYVKLENVILTYD